MNSQRDLPDLGVILSFLARGGSFLPFLIKTQTRKLSNLVFLPMSKLRFFDSLYNLKIWLLIIQADSLGGEKTIKLLNLCPGQIRKKKRERERERTQITSIRNETGTAFSFMYISL